MNRTCTFFLFTCAVASAAFAQSKFDAAGMMIMDQYRVQLAEGYAPLLNSEFMPFDVSAMTRANGKVAVYVTLNAGYGAEAVEAQGFDIIADCGDIVLASGTFADIEELAKQDFVKALSFGEKREAMLDKARVLTGVETIHAGTDLPQAFKGAGVICGIYDTGFDGQHANFRNDDGSYRYVSLWRFTGYDGTCNTYNTEEGYSRFTTDTSEGYHGTHTTGCLAGSFNKRGGGTVAIMNSAESAANASARNVNPYYGIAPEADLAVGCGGLYDANITAAAGNVRDLAKSLGKPAVFNISIGSVIGPHDGTDALSRTLDAYGKDIIICISAGNEGDQPISLNPTFTASNNSVSTFFHNESASKFSGTIDVWSNNSDPLTVTPIVYDKANGTELYSYNVSGTTEGTTYITTSNYTTSGYIHSTNFDRAFSQTSIAIACSKNTGTNNRFNARITISGSYNASSNTSKNLVLGFRISGKAGQKAEIVCKSDNSVLTDLGVAGYSAGTSVFSINTMACGQNVICVGAYNSRQRFPALGSNKTGAMYYYPDESMAANLIAPYSSYGVLSDGRKLPFVCGPGTGITASVSTPYVNTQDDDYIATLAASQTVHDRLNYWGCEQGTSMSSPIVAGGIALWLQADPTLTIDEVKEIITATALKDEYVDGSVQWGAGKFDALAGLKKVLGLDGIASVTIDDKQLLLTTDGSMIQAHIAGQTSMRAVVYNLAGAQVAEAEAVGDNLSIDASHLSAGIYIVSVNGRYAEKIAIE